MEANKKIVLEFEKLIKQIKKEIDLSDTTKKSLVNNFRLRQIIKSYEIIKTYPKQITKGEDLGGLEGIGKGTINRINEILTTGKLAEIKDDAKESDIAEKINELKKIHGIGQKMAYELIVNDNITSIDDLVKKVNSGKFKVNNTIKKGLKYHFLYKENIPRKEIDSVSDLLKKNFEIINKKNNTDLIYTICGSYRRQKETSNDIDILVTSKNTPKEKIKDVFKKIIDHLRKIKFIIDDITDNNPKTKYMGYCQYLDNPIRRIDIRFIEHQSYSAAMLYFTGSKEFNKKMRGIAEIQGFLLNEYGLYIVREDKENELVPTYSEKEIFEYLGMEYIDPVNRK